MIYQILLLWRKFKDLLSYYFDESDEYILPPSREVRDLPPPEIVPRAEWGAMEPSADDDIDDLDVPVTAVIFHHTRSPECLTKEECCKVVRQIQKHHMEGYGWPDIGYNFLVGGDARVYEGRGWKKVGAHTDEWNEKSIGVAAIGNFTEEPPHDDMLESIEKLVGVGLKDNQYLRHDYSALGHNQVDIVLNHYVCTCPGDAFYDEVTYMPHWTSGGLLIEAEEVDSDTFDSDQETDFYYTDEDVTEEDYPKGYNEEVYGPWEFN